MLTQRGAGGASLTELVYSRERIRYGVMVVVSLGVVGGLIMWGVSQPEAGASLLVYTILIPLIAWFG